MTLPEALAASKADPKHPPYRRTDDSGDLSWVVWDGDGLYQYTFEQLTATSWDLVPEGERGDDVDVVVSG